MLIIHPRPKFGNKSENITCTHTYIHVRERRVVGQMVVYVCMYVLCKNTEKANIIFFIVNLTF